MEWSERIGKLELVLILAIDSFPAEEELVAAIPLEMTIHPASGPPKKVPHRAEIRKILDGAKALTRKALDEIYALY